MRQLEEIKKDIQAIDEKINALEQERKAFTNEFNERKFADFCKRYGLRKGDVVQTKSGKEVMVCGPNNTWNSWVMVRNIRKNGEPFSVESSLLESDFGGCKVIRHIDQ